MLARAFCAPLLVPAARGHLTLNDESRESSAKEGENDDDDGWKKDRMAFAIGRFRWK